MDATPRYVLTVSGSDSSGGAGMQADNRAILAGGAFPLNVLTAVTLQTPRGVAAVELMTPTFVETQMRAILEAYPVAVIKSGMLGSSEIALRVAAVLEEFQSIPYVLDPVLCSTSGHPLLEAEGVVLVRERLMLRADLTTPNLEELRVLSEQSLSGVTAALEVAAVLASRSNGAILVKGGHGDGPQSEDWLVCKDGQREAFSSERLTSSNTRGTGCALSALIAARLATGAALAEAVAWAKEALGNSLRQQAKRPWTGSGPGFVG